MQCDKLYDRLPKSDSSEISTLQITEYFKEIKVILRKNQCEFSSSSVFSTLCLHKSAISMVYP